MTEKTFILELALKCGFKEGFVLSEMCRKIFSTDGKKNSFTVDELKDTFNFWTDSQIRTILKNLTEQNFITKNMEHSGYNNFLHKTVYLVNSGIYKEYSEFTKGNLFEKFKLASGY